MSGPILLLDAGNSRLKWALLAPHAPLNYLAEGSLAYDQLAQLPQALAQHPAASHILGCNVAGPAIAEQLAACLALPIDWLKPTASQAGLSNGYREPAQLGADRWAAMLGARSLGASDAIVVMAGTAMTVDALTAEGVFLGGLIVPGYRLMRQSLAQGTADLGLPDGSTVDFPQATGEAIVNGVLLALTGAIMQMHGRLEQHTGHGAQVWLSGGDASLLAPLLTPILATRLSAVDNLVLRGLAKLASDASPNWNPVP